MGKRVLAMVLAGVLAFTSVDLTAFAAEVKIEETVNASDVKVVDDVFETEVLADSEEDAGNSLPTDNEDQEAGSKASESDVPKETSQSGTEMPVKESDKEYVQEQNGNALGTEVGEDNTVVQDEVSSAEVEESVSNEENAAGKQGAEGNTLDDGEKYAVEGLDVDAENDVEGDSIDYAGAEVDIELDADGNIASGDYDDITWVIDADGLLTVSGTGEFSNSTETSGPPSPIYIGRAPWTTYSEFIRTAKINVTDIKNVSLMFYKCSNLTSVDLSNFDTSNVTKMYGMFSGCSSLTSLDLSGFDTSNVTSMELMFNGCSSLVSLDVSGFNTENVTSMFNMFSHCSDLTSLNVHGLNTSNVLNMAGMFFNCSSLTSLDLSGVNAKNVIRMSAMFSGCSSLTDLNLSELNTGNVTDMADMFYGCSSLESLNLNGFDTKNVINMSCMFFNCSSLESLDVSGFETGNVTSMGFMFDGCRSLSSLDLSGFDTRNVTNMFYMFFGCSSLESLDLSGFDTSNVTIMGDMFYGCSSLKSLDLSGFDTGNVTDMGSMFFGCTGLESLDLSGFETGNVTNMGGMFFGCIGLESLDLSGFDTGNVTRMANMFLCCSSLESLDLSGFDTSNVTDMVDMFNGCYSLISLDLSSFDLGNIVTDELRLYFCDSLVVLQAPKNVKCEISLYGTYYQQDGSETNTLPMNLSESVTLAKNPSYFKTGSIMEGTSNDISWKINKNGKLIINGTGDWDRSGSHDVPWLQYKGSIVSAEVTLTGTTNASSMFQGCRRMTSVSLNEFDMSDVVNINAMFSDCLWLQMIDLSGKDFSKVNSANDVFLNCNNLSKIKTPDSMAEGLSIDLPGKYEAKTSTALAGLVFESITVQTAGETLTKIREDDDISVRTVKLPFHSGIGNMDNSIASKWGWKLLTGNALPDKEFGTFDIDLAIAAMTLSTAIEQSDAKTKMILTKYLGFETTGDAFFEDSFALAVSTPATVFGYKNILVDGQEQHIFSVTVRGTTSVGDKLTDLLSVKDGFYLSALNVNQQFKSFITDKCGLDPDAIGGNSKFFITGHSLGGATANHMAKMLNEKYGAANVFAYTFASPITMLGDAGNGNIYNILNGEDIVPLLPYFFAGRFGASFWFSRRTTTLIESKFALLTGKSLSGVMDAAPSFLFWEEASKLAYGHATETYMSFLLSLTDYSILYNSEYRGAGGGICCPVDFKIYMKTDGEPLLVGSVTNNEIDNVDHPLAAIRIDGDKKYFYLPFEGEYFIEFTGNADGTMKYFVQSMDYNTGEPVDNTGTAFENVQLTSGKKFASEIRVEEGTVKGITTEEPKLYVTDPETGTPTSEVHTDGTEESLIKTFTVTFDLDGGTAIDPQTVTENEKATEPTAPVKEGFTFTGWYLGEALFDFGTVITSDITLKAGWKADGETEEPNKPEEPNPDTPSPEDPSNPGEPDTSEDLAKWGDILPEDRPADGVIPTGLWIAGIDENGYTYNGAAIKPAVRVYDNNVMLKAKKDYTITYVRNKKANNASKASTAPAVKVKGKGNYSGAETATFKINPIDITEQADVDNICVPFSGKAQKPVPIVKVNGKTLKKKTDFKYSYKDSAGKAVKSFKAPGTYQIVISGMKNYSGTKTIDFVISEKGVKLMSKATVSKIADKPYTGNDITLTDADQFAVKHGSTVLTENEHYTLSYRNNQAVGTAVVLVKAIEGSGYAGEKVVTFKIVGEDIGKASVSGIFDVEYSGHAARQDALALTLDSIPLQKDTDYTVSYQNNVDVGTAELVIAGKGKYTGSMKQTFKITQCNVENSALKVADISDAKYAKGGCKPEPLLSFTNSAGRTIKLVKDKDYTLSYSGNQNVGEGMLQITGKGNFTGSKTVSFSIGQQDFKNVRIEVSDKVYSVKKDAYKSAVKVYDPDGTALKAGVDYDGNVTYTYADGTEIGDAAPSVGSEIKVTVTAMGSNYAGTGDAVYRITKASITKAKVTVKNPTKKNKNMFEYTGKPVMITKENLKVKVDKNTLKGDQYEILEDTYRNNVNRGTASVQIRGLGDYGGTVTVKFKIGTKGFKWFWRLLR